MPDSPAAALIQSQFHRLTARGGKTVSFTIDGVAHAAFEGDLLITAILAVRGSLRRFEFGDGDRAGFCLMGACQDCWVTLATGERLRACTTLVRPGMAVVIDGTTP